MSLPPVTAARIHTASQHLANAETAAIACREAGLPYFVACALLEKESGGQNVFGHDPGGALCGAGLVTLGKWLQFRHLVIDGGHTSNGVGPCQLTWPGFFTDMEHQGLKPYSVHDNMLYGFRLMAHLYQLHGSWAAAGTAYNGSPAYGIAFAVDITHWRGLLGV